MTRQARKVIQNISAERSRLPTPTTAFPSSLPPGRNGPQSAHEAQICRWPFSTPGLCSRPQTRQDAGCPLHRRAVRRRRALRDGRARRRCLCWGARVRDPRPRGRHAEIQGRTDESCLSEGAPVAAEEDRQSQCQEGAEEAEGESAEGGMILIIFLCSTSYFINFCSGKLVGLGS